MPRVGLLIEALGEQATVRASRRGVCADCSGSGACSFENALGKGEPETVTVYNPIRARPGDYVEFDLTGHTELKVSLLVWVVPLVGLVLGAVAGSAAHVRLSMGPDVATLLGAIAGFIAAFAVVKWVDRRSGRDARLVPHILKVVDPSACHGLVEPTTDANPAQDSA